MNDHYGSLWHRTALRDDLLAANHTVVGIARRRQEATDRFFPAELDLSDLDFFLGQWTDYRAPFSNRRRRCCATRPFRTLDNFPRADTRID